MASAATEDAASRPSGSGSNRQDRGYANPHDFHWIQLRQESAHLQYRDNAESEWTRLEDSYESWTPKDNMAEPWNVEQWYIRAGEIEVNQFGSNWRPADKYNDPLPSWQVKFGLLRDMIISEYEVNGRKYCVIRFKCGTAPVGRLVGEVGEEEVEESEVVEEVAGDNTADVEMTGSNPSAIKWWDPRTFPLAKLFCDPGSFVGKEIRLGFLRRSPDPKHRYTWAWPAAIDFLSGVEQYHNHPSRHQSWKEPLDKWALEHMDNLKAVRLIEKKITPEQPKTGAREFTLVKKTPIPEHVAVPSSHTPLPGIPSRPPPPSSLGKMARGDDRDEMAKLMEQMPKAKADWLKSKQQTDEKWAHYEAIVDRLGELSMGDSSKKRNEA